MTDKISYKVDAALESFDGMIQAEPKPFLLTRIRAAQNRIVSQNAWMKISAFIKQPAVAACSIVLLLVFNVALFNARNSSSKNENTTGRMAASKYDFSTNVSGIYDTETPEQ